MTAVRPPAVAGAFYPGSPQALDAMLTELLDGPLRAAAELTSATPGEATGASRPAPKAVIAPHAGYIYSGSTAALAYARLAAARDTVRRVVLLGPCHHVGIRGIALPAADAFATPLGEVTVDADAIEELRAAGLPQVGVSREAHAPEHSLEVHVPFLQRVLPDATLVPLAVGWVEPEEVAEVIDTLWGGPETAIVVSSDLSHYLPYDKAREVDARSLGQILDGTGRLAHEQACGATPVNGLVVAAQRRCLTPELLGACNSGDTAGDKQRVVGYASLAYPHEGAAA